MNEYYYMSKEKLKNEEEIWPFQYGKNNADLLNLCDSFLLSNNLSLLEATYRDLNKILPSALIETIFENIRKKEFETKPHRLKSVHLFIKYVDVFNFRLRYRQDKGYIYKAKIVNGIQFEGDMELVTPGIGPKSFQEELELLMQRAHDYWTGRKTAHPIVEKLVEGRVITAELINSA